MNFEHSPATSDVDLLTQDMLTRSGMQFIKILGGGTLGKVVQARDTHGQTNLPVFLGRAQTQCFETNTILTVGKQLDVCDQDCAFPDPR